MKIKATIVFLGHADGGVLADVKISDSELARLRGTDDRGRVSSANFPEPEERSCGTCRWDNEEPGDGPCPFCQEGYTEWKPIPRDTPPAETDLERARRLWNEIDEPLSKKYPWSKVDEKTIDMHNTYESAIAALKKQMWEDRDMYALYRYIRDDQNDITIETISDWLASRRKDETASLQAKDRPRSCYWCGEAFEKHHPESLACPHSLGGYCSSQNYKEDKK